ncbi:pyridoxamine 5'-phosphate oxidase family protein [Luteolibacter sp. Populi]|uniref:pyridoxamine 5'-phosphate oxidase family protein n=1 Tax=Luteolibacter sp. Populi TaxID=3230487 RepID=UPI00346537DF
MGTTQNLVASEAVEKMRELVGDSPTCMLATNIAGVPPHLCPMQVQDVDDEGCLWFFSGADSAHNSHVQADPRVQLIFSNNSKHEYLAVYGTAEITNDIDKVDELWSSMVKTWFPQGKDDPNLTLIRVCPEKVHYWDVKDGKLVAMAKILLGAVTGHPQDIGIEGDLKP